MEKLRIGLIGAGAIAASHMPQLRRRDDAVELASVADVDEAAAGQCAREYGFSAAVTDYRAMLAQVDAVLICTPTHLHAEMAIECLSAGKAVFCEKPLARTLEQAEKIVAAAMQADRPLQVGFVRRFDPEWLAWREAVLGNRIGRPVVWRDIAASSGPGGRWFFDHAQGGGPLLDGCIHSLDFAIHTFGPIATVFCHGQSFKSHATAIDTASATVRFVSGDELLLAWSWGLPAGCRGTRVFELLGPSGLIQWPTSASEPRRFTIINGPEQRSEVPYPADALAQAYDLQMDEFIQVARGARSPRAGGAEGSAALAAALALIDSARTGGVARLAG